MLARCPTCRATFSTERTGQQSCPACGKPLFVPEAPPVLAATAGDPATGAVPRFGDAPGDAPAQQPGTPWERRPELPLLQAWKETMTLALFEPGKLFSLARLDKQAEQATFAVLTFSVFSIIGQLLEGLLIGPQQERMFAQLKEVVGDRIPPALMKILEGSQHRSMGGTLLALLLAPLVGVIFVYLNAAVTHLFAMLFGQNRKGFAATFAACAYAMAPAVLLAIPGCGQPVALVWTIVLTGVGLKRAHGITTGGATAAALGPYLILCCALCGLGLVFASVAGSLLTGAAGAN